MMNPKLVAALVAFGLLMPALTAHSSASKEQIVNQMNKLFGVHDGFLANHAKGVVEGGSRHFGLSKAVMCDVTEIPVTGAVLGLHGSAPNLPDGSDDPNPAGHGLKFHLPTAATRTFNSLKFFPVSKGEEFRQLLVAIAQSSQKAVKPTKHEQWGKPLPSHLP